MNRKQITATISGLEAWLRHHPPGHPKGEHRAEWERELDVLRARERRGKEREKDNGKL